MIDENGLRANVGIVIINDENKVLWAKRTQADNAWQFPQGGIQQNESPQEAMYRELDEELGLAADSVEIIACTDRWLTYYLPKRYRRYHETPMCIGQKQKWFLLRFLGSDRDVSLDKYDKPEFDDWCWQDFWYPIRHVVAFKQDVYRKALREFAGIIGVERR